MAADYVQTELLKREIERERRDREFWRVMFGGEPDLEPEVLDTTTPPHLSNVLSESDDEIIARSMMRR